MEPKYFSYPLIFAIAFGLGYQTSRWQMYSHTYKDEVTVLSNDGRRIEFHSIQYGNQWHKDLCRDSERFSKELQIGKSFEFTYEDQGDCMSLSDSSLGYVEIKPERNVNHVEENKETYTAQR
jgi:hypothetical protein